ncbi:hypothetical protein FRUB_06277 [Fimbriiglobus ruber]|uniref:Uncharacterized protein n=1 Tax=Fimbriiglobus ruber TaxID=1908690 RepID=A0A225DS26_9BACT|nr:hypothetical protein FRUB_06277 [Fimbriiglobus ruber]
MSIVTSETIGAIGAKREQIALSADGSFQWRLAVTQYGKTEQAGHDPGS